MTEAYVEQPLGSKADNLGAEEIECLPQEPLAGTFVLAASPLQLAELPSEDEPSDMTSSSWTSSSEEEDENFSELEVLMEEEEESGTALLKTAHELDEAKYIEEQERENALPYDYAPEDSSLRKVGVIEKTVHPYVVVLSEPLPAHKAGAALDIGNLLVLEGPERFVLGRVLDTFGPITRPYYSIYETERLREFQKNSGLVDLCGRSVFFDPESSALINIKELRLLSKGTDASNVYDEELSEGDQEFSDDEQEQQAKQRWRRVHGKGPPTSGPNGPQPVAQGTTPQSLPQNVRYTQSRHGTRHPSKLPTVTGPVEYEPLTRPPCSPPS